MMHKQFNRKRLRIKSLFERKSDLNISIIKDCVVPASIAKFKALKAMAQKVCEAKQRHAAVILMMGGHVIRSGVQKYIIDLMEKGYISCVAMNGAGMIHDYEFALAGVTTESVARYIKEGQFGLWRQTGRINDYINKGYRRGLGMGEAIGKAIAEGCFPYKKNSLLAVAYQLKIPITIHIGVGYDIIHEFPNCDGAATGATSYKDFLYFANVISHLEGGLLMNFGSAVMAPEVFLKALSMARNVAHQSGKTIRHFTVLVCDLHKLPKQLKREPNKEIPDYYFRPWKTMLVRTVAEGGKSYYVRGPHAETLPSLWSEIRRIGDRIR